jgi:hypothetical protein
MLLSFWTSELLRFWTSAVVVVVVVVVWPRSGPKKFG